MRGPIRRSLVALLSALTLGAFAAPALASWPMYGHDIRNSRDGGTEGPTRAQAPATAEKWRFDSPTGDFTGTPVVANGVVVAGDYSGTVYALDAITGKLRWKKKLDGQINGSSAIHVNAPDGPAVYVPVSKPGAPRLVALSLATGTQRWSTVLTTQDGTAVFSSPVFYKGAVYIGTSGPNGDDSSARGTVVALDQRTGAVRWRTFTVPDNRDGGPVWSTPTIDATLNRMFVGTGNAYHAPAAPTTDAILKMNPDTGQIISHYQAIPSDIFSPDNPLGADTDFGASPNLFTSPSGKLLVGEGAKDGKYYAVDRGTMKKVWVAANGPGSVIGGFIGSTAFDGTRIYGTNALSGQIAAFNRSGSVAWTNGGGGTTSFSPVATANGIVYTVSPSGSLVLRSATSGAELKSLPLGKQSFGGVSVTGRAVYAAVGIGPAPPPAPQDQYGTGSIIAFGDTSRSGAPQGGGGTGGGGTGGGGGGGTGNGDDSPRRGKSKCRVRAPRGARLRLRVRPRKVRAGRRVKFRFRVTCKGRPVRRATVRFAHRHKRTGRRGRATIRVKLHGHCKRVARVRKKHLRSGRAVVRVKRRKHA
jgi:polyvinyl alcohol dehydrogenase (cytochrome)